ncbi:hypothetical protein B0H10DRAFT_2232513 [Mycena sp. CBHHK59/15]|nr:hypothetical protein B0H10DRAFT_2232513 [Mycena sp. CBHHK59/15]
MENTPVPPLICSQSKCDTVLEPGGPKTCDRCRKQNTQNRRDARKRKRDKQADEAEKRARTDSTPGYNEHDAGEEEDGVESGEEGDPNNNTFTQFKDAQELFSALRNAFNKEKHVNFRGTYQIPEDALITDKERVQMTVHEIWKVTGYRFR